MSEKYIRQNKNSCNIVKNSKIYAKIADLDDAVFIRDFLADNDWDLNKIPQILKKEDDYLVLTIHEDKIHLIGKYKVKPGEDTIVRLIKKHRRNPNNSKYGLNITRVFDVFIIKKRIAGDDYIFGYYDKLEDAEFVRNFLMDNCWNVSEFKEIEFDDDAGNYKVVRVFDDKVYVLDTFADDNIDLNRVYEEFLAKISKHKHGLAHYPHLEPLKDSISNLEEEFNVKARDENWNLSEISDNPLNDIIFNLTPFQKSVYDAIDGEATFDEIKRKLIRYRSRNFEDKISRNLDSLCELKLIEKNGDVYIKIK